MKSITDLFIQRPVLAIVVNIVVIIAGLQALSSVSVRQYPRTDDATIVVTTAYIGADADLVRGFITTPIERSISAADGIDFVQSESTLGLSIVRARLNLNYDPNKALSEISAKVDKVRGDLPPEAEVPVIDIESSDSQFAAAYLSFSSDILNGNEITDYLNRVVKPRLDSVDGVQEARILGDRTFAMRIWLKPDRMAALDITAGEVRMALANNNYLAAVGQTKGNFVRVNLTADTDIRTEEAFRRLIIREDEGAIIRLEDLADVQLGAENYEAEVRFSGQTATFIGVFALPTANVIEVIRGVREELDKISAALPTGLIATVAYDSTEYINDAIKEVTMTLVETLIIVVVVIFLFLGSLRSVLVPAVAIPVSLIGALFLIQVFGFTINLLTLLAIVLSVGLVVDDAIVMVENVERNMRRGLSPKEAAIKGARELVGPVIAMTITLASVYAPIGLQGGLTGALFREFAFTLAGAVLISGFVAITLSPVMSASLLRNKSEDTGLSARINKGFQVLRKYYGAALDAVLSVRPLVYGVWVLLVGALLPMYMLSPNELAPTEDQGIVFSALSGPANATIEQSIHFSEPVNDVFMGFPETQFTFQIILPTGGFAGMGLVPWSQRERTAMEIQPEVQGRLSINPGVDTFVLLPAPLPGGSDFPVEFLITSTANAERLLEFATQLQDLAAASGKFAFPPMIDLKIDQPQTRILINRERVADLGLDMRQVGADVAAAVGGNFVNRFSIAGRSYKVIPQVERIARLNPEQLEDLYIRGPEGQTVPLSTVATLQREVVPRSLNRFQQLNAVKLSGVAITTLDDALSFMEAEAAKLLPQGYNVDYTGQSRQLRTEGGKFVSSLVLALVLVFLVLAAQFNSFRDPLVILLGSVPLAIFGALCFTFLRMLNPNIPFFTDGFTTSINIYSQVGLVTLAGIISKNGILIVEFANVLQREGLEKLTAIREAARIRLRPVLMTSMATIIGHFPLVLVSGAGAEARNSIGLIVVGGMAIGTFFTLFFVPCLYMLIAKDRGGKLTEFSDHRIE
ncbi:MAG: efflux RND transporter permease subunit [Puniceicoccaceae bacterium]